MAAPISAVPSRPVASSGFKAFAAVAVLGMAIIVSVIALGAWNAGAFDDVPLAQSQYGAGYPLHGGLAGPSQLDQVARTSYGAGYPQHGGLAGPSRISVFEYSSYGAGYPVHGGLAGPSQLDQVTRSSFGPGYPMHGGLAGPSHVDGER